MPSMLFKLDHCYVPLVPLEGTVTQNMTKPMMPLNSMSSFLCLQNQCFTLYYFQQLRPLTWCFILTAFCTAVLLSWSHHLSQLKDSTVDTVVHMCNGVISLLPLLILYTKLLSWRDCWTLQHFLFRVVPI